ncbi:hypothetical protein LJC68_08075 [Bacteroidales bacterium OttesenSCG-928-B11]|nr:hypothetical protein [Bacteroidales bacterium OttesenSCG-928-B11]MDL2326478.1 hypothetical protein [Bacteroidales bacterium OttesenSCG-928-A14]
MKRIRLIAIITMAALIGSSVFYSCNKDENISSIETKSIKAKFIGEISLMENPYPAEDYLLNKEDPEEEKLDRQLYEIGLVAKHFFKDASLNRYIIENAVERANDCIDLRSFKTWPPVLKGEYPAEKIDELQKILDGTKLTCISRNPETYGKVENYIPAIFVANIENADPEKMPIFSPGVFVNEDLPGMDKFEDCIVVWCFNKETGEFEEGLMSEEMALATTSPLFIVDNASEVMIERKKGNNVGGWTSSPCSYDVVTTEMKTNYYSSYEHQINVRYENSGKSELCVASYLINENGAAHGVVNASGWHLIDKVKKADVGKLLRKWVTFCRPNAVGYSDVTPFGCNYLFWNTFERDWAKSLKNLGIATKNGTTIYLAGNMKSETNWFQFDPSIVKNNPVDFMYIFSAWSKMHNGAAGKLGVWRIQP